MTSHYCGVTVAPTEEGSAALRMSQPCYRFFAQLGPPHITPPANRSFIVRLQSGEDSFTPRDLPTATCLPAYLRKPAFDLCGYDTFLAKTLRRRRRVDCVLFILKTPISFTKTLAVISTSSENDFCDTAASMTFM